MPKKKMETPEVIDAVFPEETATPAAEQSEVSGELEAADEAAMDIGSEEHAPLPEIPPPKPKRTRKKKADTVDGEDISEVPPSSAETDSTPKETTDKERQNKPKADPILTIEAGSEVTTDEHMADIAWHEIHNAYRTRRILTGFLGGLERNDAGKTVAVVEYKGYRVLIPFKEMAVGIPNQLTGKDYNDMVIRYNKLFSNMMGCEIDFIVRGIDSKTRSVVSSRAEAMLKKRKTFYFDITDEGTYRIYEGRIVQARVIAVAEKAIRVEIFGAECSIMARDLAWDWIGDAHERFAVGDQVLVRVLKVNRESLEKLSVKADVKSVSDNSSRENLQKCRIQSKYAGRVTDVHKGVVFIRLTNGVNAIAHSCLDRRMPGKKDDVSFAVTHIDEEQGVAVGIITRIIKQHL
ncbi:MAG: S1 RNA-binding domain-containing protein [Eubacteriales bacterium]